MRNNEKVKCCDTKEIGGIVSCVFLDPVTMKPIVPKPIYIENDGTEWYLTWRQEQVKQ